MVYSPLGSLGAGQLSQGSPTPPALANMGGGGLGSGRFNAPPPGRFDAGQGMSPQGQSGGYMSIFQAPQGFGPDHRMPQGMPPQGQPGFDMRGPSQPNYQGQSGGYTSSFQAPQGFGSDHRMPAGLSGSPPTPQNVDTSHWQGGLHPMPPQGMPPQGMPPGFDMRGPIPPNYQGAAPANYFAPRPPVAHPAFGYGQPGVAYGGQFDPNDPWGSQFGGR